jgi:organic hydroperoxide reductase OsmC/OhrA
MMGTLATGLASRNILTRSDLYSAKVEGDIEAVDGVLRITRIRVDYTLKVPADKADEAREVFASYIKGCPAAVSVRGCIDIIDDLRIVETDNS